MKFGWRGALGVLLSAGFLISRSAAFASAR